MYTEFHESTYDGSYRCYPMKNRLPDVLPFDASRVELPTTKDDYINASRVRDLSRHAPSFIATQAPAPNTFTDFWTMVWQEQVGGKLTKWFTAKASKGLLCTLFLTSLHRCNGSINKN